MTTSILILASNPSNTSRLRLDEEVREIENGMDRAKQRDQFVITPKLAVRPQDMQRAMLDYSPNIIHFCGHGEGDDGIALENNAGNTQLVQSHALADLFKLFKTRSNIQCVVLNACYSEAQAEAISEHIPYVVGMKKAIGDKAAIIFAVAFYDAIGAGESIEFAYELGCNAVQMENIDEHLTPVLKYNPTSQNSKQVTKKISTTTKKTRSFELDETISANTSTQYDIFISYRSTQRAWVETLASNLRDQGYKVFLDIWEISGGESFTKKIFAALNNSRCALLLATPEATESGWVQEEYEYMLNLSNSRDDFFWIPLVLGEFPDLPFLSNIHAIDFADSNEDNYRRAFQQLLSSIKQQAPDANPHFTGTLKLPEVEQSIRPLVDSEHSFIDSIFSYLNCSMPVMLLAQRDTSTQHYAHALKQTAQQRYGEDNVLHIFPPASSRADTAACFSRMATQCGFDKTICESWEWADALRERLQQGENLLLLVTNFENGPDKARAELSGELRSLLADHPFELKLILIGGESLAGMKYENGAHSLLNALHEIRLPEIGLHDSRAIYLQRYPDLKVKDQTLQAILDYTGHHPRLLETSLQALQQGLDWQETLQNGLIPSQLFSRFRDDVDSVPLCNLLNKQQLGRYDAWPQDELVRRLYWANLITHAEGQFIWRCEFVCSAGLEVLGC